MKKNAHNNIKIRKGCASCMDKEIKKQEKEEEIEYGVAEVGEDATKYGEFISTYFAWVSLPEQKEKVEKLQSITKKKNDKKERK